jgi:predicted dehydrogenase
MAAHEALPDHRKGPRMATPKTLLVVGDDDRNPYVRLARADDRVEASHVPGADPMDVFDAAARVQPELVLCVTGPERNYEVLEAVVARGLRVLMDAPPATNLVNAKRLQELQQLNGCRLVYAIEAGLGLDARLLAFLRRNELGPLRSIQASCRARRRPGEPGRGAWLDLAAYPVVALRGLLGAWPRTDRIELHTAPRDGGARAWRFWSEPDSAARATLWFPLTEVPVEVDVAYVDAPASAARFLDVAMTYERGTLHVPMTVGLEAASGRPWVQDGPRGISEEWHAWEPTAGRAPCERLWDAFVADPPDRIDHDRGMVRGPEGVHLQTILDGGEAPAGR